MSMSDIVSALDQPWLAEAALVLFIVSFGAIVVRLYRTGHRERDRAAANLPLNDEPAFARTVPAQRD